MSYLRRKLSNLGEYAHPAHVKALLSGKSAEERRAVRRGLRPQPLPHEGKQAILREYARFFRMMVFIETGTFRGDMVHALLDEFKTLHTIELAADLAEAARTRFQPHPHVNVHHGDSAAVLPRLLAQIHEPCLFWLDGHSSGHDTAKGPVNTPILAELTVIRHHATVGHVILIDDAREFGRGKHYPSLRRVRKAIGPRYSGFEIKDDIIRITP
jgi:hypothetical protein